MIACCISCAYNIRIMNKHSTTRASGAAKAALVNRTLDQALVDEARALGVSISAASNQGLAVAVKKARGEAWLDENRAALQSSNEWVEANGQIGRAHV